MAGKRRRTNQSGVTDFKKLLAKVKSLTNVEAQALKAKTRGWNKPHPYDLPRVAGQKLFLKVKKNPDGSTSVQQTFWNKKLRNLENAHNESAFIFRNNPPSIQKKLVKLGYSPNTPYSLKPKERTYWRTIAKYQKKNTKKLAVFKEALALKNIRGKGSMTMALKKLETVIPNVKVKLFGGNSPSPKVFYDVVNSIIARMEQRETTNIDIIKRDIPYRPFPFWFSLQEKLKERFRQQNIMGVSVRVVNNIH